MFVPASRPTRAQYGGRSKVLIAVDAFRPLGRRVTQEAFSADISDIRERNQTEFGRLTEPRD